MTGIKREFYGKTNEGNEVELFTLSNATGMTLKVSNFGGVVVSLTVPDITGKYDDIVLGYDRLEGYLLNKPFFGGIIGRHANRIEGASFEINGITCKVTKNEGDNQLHGGCIGFHKVIWDAKPEVKEEAESIIFAYTSKDGEEGYPGNLEVQAVKHWKKQQRCLMETAEGSWRFLQLSRGYNFIPVII
jgi:aldose 1-epimerase